MIDARQYDADRDKTAVNRIWLEAGWTDREKQDNIAIFMAGSRNWVADVAGAAECHVTMTPGTLRYLAEDLSLTGVTAVLTSRIARRQGLAGGLTAHAIAVEAAEGVLVAGLGMFEQGFYNRLGFGTGSYELNVGFDPARLRVPAQARVPRRLSGDDWQLIHAARLARWRRHGGCNFHPPDLTRAEMTWGENGFGLGYCDGPNGELTHHFWASTRDVENGPYHIWWLSYQNWDQFLELLALLHSLGDQVKLVRLNEPPGIQLQDFVRQPFRHRQITRKGDFDSQARALAYWQMRILDLAGCLARTYLPGPAVRFNLTLHDPIEDFLPEDAPWRGLGGQYVVTLGPESAAVAGFDPALPMLTASVGAFTRLWLGVRPASGLAATGELAGPPVLLAELDEQLRLPAPHPDWDF